MNDKHQRASQARRSKLMRRLIMWAVVLIVIIGGVYLFVLYLKHQDQTLPGVVYEMQGREHIEPGSKHDSYNSNPPTSGPHYASPAPWGVYRDALPDGQLIHNLEHGGVWISYKPGISQDIAQKLEGFSKKYGSKIIVTPRKENDTDIALTVWTRLEKFNAGEYSDERVDNFIRRLRNKTAPEPFAQ